MSDKQRINNLQRNHQPFLAIIPIKSLKNDFLIMENFINPKQVYADLRSDFMFKKAFGQKHIMIPFLNAILKIKGF